MTATNLFDILIEHEGLKNKPYRDTAGRLTIGVGRNLDDIGISDAEAVFLMKNDIERCKGQIKNLAWYQSLDYVRQEVIIELIFNIGFDAAMKFTKMIACIVKKDYKGAASELLNSDWAREVGYLRSSNMAYRLQFGKY